MTIYYVVCYKDPEYTRTSSLMNALSKIEDVDLVVIKNRYRNPTRYIEVVLKLVKYRIKNKPDISIVGFRGHEVFWVFYPFLIGSKIVFDEFINLHDWLVSEHKKFPENSLTIRALDNYMRWVVNNSDSVLTDTLAHKELSAVQHRISTEKITVIPVGADERLFFPRNRGTTRKNFEVLFYGNMLPLHGMEHMLHAISMITLPDMHFTIIGGKGNERMISYINRFIKDNKLEKKVTHIPWIPYSELPDFVEKSDLCLGGPFGNTGQAKRVITGKTYQFLAMGKPTVVGKIEHMEGLEDKQNALIVNQGSSREIKDSIEWAYLHREKLKTIGENGRVLYEQGFSSRAISVRLQKLFQMLTSA